jgi:hypothetical protein
LFKPLPVFLFLVLAWPLTACQKSEKSVQSTEGPTAKTQKNTAEPASNGDEAQKPSKTAAAQPVAKAPTNDEPNQSVADSTEIVFDPTKPPAGYANCHHNHCHLIGGGVESYQQVMTKMGATKIIRPPEPKAPADAAAPPQDATRTARGLAYKMLTPGTSEQNPGPDSVVMAHLSSWQTSGKFLSNTAQGGRPATIPMGRVFPGLQEAFQLMTVGSEYRFWVPAALIYGGQRGDVVVDAQLIAVRDGAHSPPK